MQYLTLGTLWKQEDSYALDFLTLHRYLGVEHFVIFDRENTTLPELLKNEKDVEIIHFPEQEGNNHMSAWGKLIEYNQGKTKWLALIDADQCLISEKCRDIKTVLENYEEFASLQVNWKTFGSSFKEYREEGSIYERFLLRGKDDCIYNLHTQFICQPNRTLAVPTKEPHYPLLPEGEISVNTNKEQISANKIIELNPNTPLSFNSPPLFDTLWCGHYTNKSRQEFIEKNNKGRADIYGLKMNFNQFDEYDKVANEIEETRVLELWKEANK